MNISSAEKKERIARAALLVIQKGGFAMATYRNIAEESGFSLGSIQNFFKTQNELYRFAMETIIKNGEARANSLKLFHNGASVEEYHQFLHQFLPLDAERHTELTAWMAFVSRAATEPSLMDIARRMISKNYQTLEWSIEFMQQHGLFNESLVPMEASRRLYVFLEGISLHSIVLPDQYTETIITEMVQHYVDDNLIN